MTSHVDSPRRPCPYCDGFLASASSPASWDTELEGSNAAAAIVPTRGSLLPGWLLVVPRIHVLNSRLLPAQSRALFRDAVRAAQTLVGSAFGPATLFEHGPSAPGTAVGCGIDHVHVHVVALSFDLVTAARVHPDGTSLEWTTSPINDVSKGYLWVRTPDGAAWHATGSIPSQFFRRVIASAIGMPAQFDWRLEANPAALRETLARVPAASRVDARRLAS